MYSLVAVYCFRGSADKIFYVVLLCRFFTPLWRQFSLFTDSPSVWFQFTLLNSFPRLIQLFFLVFSRVANVMHVSFILCSACVKSCANSPNLCSKLVADLSTDCVLSIESWSRDSLFTSLLSMEANCCRRTSSRSSISSYSISFVPLFYPCLFILHVCSVHM